MTSVSVSPVGASLGLVQGGDVDSSQRSNLLSDPINSVTPREDEDLEGVSSVIRRELALDRTTESNALPFVLQGYAAWISRLAFDPLKVAGIARNFVFNHFEDGEQSRWIVVLLANIGSSNPNSEFLDTRPNLMFTALQTAVRQQLAEVKSRPNPNWSESVRALDSAVEAMSIHFYHGSPGEAMTLRYDAAPIFRQLCPELPDTPVDLPSLLQHPLGCLRQYAGSAIIFSVLTDIPTFFRYEVAASNGQPDPSAPIIQEDGIVQWVYGIPDQIVLAFAKMKAIHQGGLAPDKQTVASLERHIRSLQPFVGSSSDRFVTIMRSVVQECWRQAAFVYLYMALCGDSSNTPRVKQAVKRFMRLLNGTKPGRSPDEFLASTLIIVSPAAQRHRDREVIRQRALGLDRRGQAFAAKNHIMCFIEDYWARADAEGRPILWSDIAVSRRIVLGM